MFDAATFLAEITGCEFLPLIGGPADLPEPWRELYEELAAIREYDGGQARDHAEAEALREVLAVMRTAGCLR